jgi:hypothetical protein
MQGSCVYQRRQKSPSGWLLSLTLAVFNAEPKSQSVRVFHIVEFLGVCDTVIVYEGDAGVLCV